MTWKYEINDKGFHMIEKVVQGDQEEEQVDEALLNIQDIDDLGMYSKEQKDNMFDVD